MLASEGVRNIEQFNNIIRAEKDARDEETGEELKPLHYIVIVIDELADLMMVSSQRGRGVDHAAGPDGARGRHPPHPGHPAALGGRDHRPDQGQLPLPHLLPGGGPGRQPHDPRLDRRRAAARPGRHALPAPGQRAAHPRPRRLRDRARDRPAHLLPAQAGRARLRRHGRQAREGRRRPWRSPTGTTCSTRPCASSSRAGRPPRACSSAASASGSRGRGASST